MDTRQTKKRGWTLSPEKKKARTSLDFMENTPPAKRKRSSSGESEDDSQFTVKSFYGGRDKKSFPHSPGRRKAANKVLKKLNAEDEEEFLSLRKQVPGEVLKYESKAKKEVFKFSSTSSDSEPVEVLKERNKNTKSRGHAKVSPNGEKRSVRSAKKQSPVNSKKSTQDEKRMIGNAESVQKLDIDGEQTATPISNRKFFKTKSPSSAPKTLGSVIISKGFNLKFLPKRRSMPSHKIKTSPAKMNKKSKTKEVYDDTEIRDLVGNKTQCSGSPEIETESSLDSGYNSRTSHFGSQRSPGKVPAKQTDSQTSCEAVPSPSKKRTIKTSSQQTKALKLRDENSTETGSEASPSKRLLTNKTSNEPTPTKGCKMKTSNQVISPLKRNDQTPTRRTGNQITACSIKKTRVTGTPNSSQVQTESDTVSIDGSADLFSDSNKMEDVSETSSDVSGPSQRPQKKLFPIFDGTPTTSPVVHEGLNKSLRRGSPRQSPRLRARPEKDKEQMVLDAGQKKFGAVQCEVCGMVYRHADPSDEAMHDKFHQDLLNVLKFPGWKKERVVQEFPEDCSRIIMVLHDDPKYAVKKIEDINKIMGQEMGFPEASLEFRSKYKAFLFISEDKKVDGCCIAEPVTQGYRVLTDSQPSQTNAPQPGHRPWYCHPDPEPAAVGISRIWVFGQQRRRKIATKLLDAVRQWFEYGVYIEKSQVAFSDPTSDGKQLACKYTGIPTFLVYKYD